ncbi:ComF family protein [Synechocystis sp. LKSZ1]|uniref:ComF family protein n=1 Tax=Synechocystis sp. LKSZ1 TaxID=3144951 RepID=UPI00336BF8B2
MVSSFFSLLFQPTCPLCQRRAAALLCENCQAQLYSYRLAQPAQAWSAACPRFIWGQYEGKLKQAIAALKYDRQPALAEWLGFELAEAWLQAFPQRPGPKPVVIPIPLHPQKLKERGFNQAELLARAFCRLTRYPLLAQGLLRVKNTAPLFDLNPQARRAMVAQSLQPGPKLEAVTQPVLLIDDIYTTGATVQEACRALSQASKTFLGLVAMASPP